MAKPRRPAAFDTAGPREDDPQTAKRTPAIIRVNRNTPESLEQMLDAVLKPWRKQSERKFPTTRKQWETALRLGGLNDVSLDVLLNSRNTHQLTGLHGYIASLLPKPPAAKNANDPRDRWVYQQLQRPERSLTSILLELKRLCQPKGWEPIGSVQGLRAAAKRYAARHNKPPLVRRKRS